MPPDGPAGGVPAIYVPERERPGGGPGGILALDLSSSMGWCYGTHQCRMPLFGTIHLRGEGGEAGRYARCENELAPMIVRFQPRKLMIEGHIPLQAMHNVDAARQQFGLRAMALSEAWRAGIPHSEIDVNMIRYSLLGQRVSRDSAKREVVRYCFRLGLKVPDHHAADAALLWLWHKTQVTGIPPMPDLLSGGHRYAN